MNMVSISSLLATPVRLDQHAVRRRLNADLLDEGDMRELVRIVAARFPHVFDVAWNELVNGGAA